MLRRNAVFKLVAVGFVPLVCMLLMTGCPPTPVPECAVDADCAEGQVCDNGVCTDAPAPECEADIDCAEGQACEDGVCVDAPEPECQEDADCAEGQVCEDGVCVDAPEPECEEDADCADGQVCEEGVCVEGPEDPPHKTLLESIGQSDYQGTQTCLTCHSNHAANIMETAHWNWSGVVDDIEGLEDQIHGKVDLINDY